MDDGAERSAPPTPRRIARSRDEGDVARSALAPIAFAMLLGGCSMYGIASYAPRWLSSFADDCARAAIDAARGAEYFNPSHTFARPLTGDAGFAVGIAWAGALAASLAAASVTGALGWSPGALRPRAARLSPAAGLKSLLGTRSITSIGVALLGSLAAIAPALPIIAEQVARSGTRTASGAAPQLIAASAGIYWWHAAGALVLAAAVEIALVRHMHRARLRMTPRELREERVQSEGKPEVKARRRSVATRRLRKLRLASLKSATVVVANPTHVAVAVRYAPPLIDVPIVVCAGADLAAGLVRAAAELHGVPIIVAPELARTLYAQVDVDEPIPEECYTAVAAVFAHILRRRGRLQGADGP